MTVVRRRVLPPQARLDALAREWSVTVASSFETAQSLIAYGERGAQPVVIKLARRPVDEGRSAEALSCFDPAGVARVYDWRDDAMLLERLSPGTTLAQLVNAGHDRDATDILADVIARLAPRCTPARLPA